MGAEMSGRLILAIVTTLIEEAVLAAVYLLGLPQLGLEPPLWLLVLLMAVWAGLAVFTYRKGTKALERKPPAGLPSVVGCRGKVVRALTPEGLVAIGSELWTARSSAGRIEAGEEVIVIKQRRTRLVVRRRGAAGQG